MRKSHGVPPAATACSRVWAAIRSRPRLRIRLRATVVPKQRHQLRAGRIAKTADVLGVDFPLRRFDAHPANGGFAVLDLGGELVVRRQAVADRDGREALLGEQLGDARQLRLGCRICHAPPWTTSTPGNGPSPRGTYTSALSGPPRARRRLTP